MSTLSSPRSSLDRTSPARSKTKSNTWALSLTAICFLFGGLLAMQLRAVKTNADHQALEKKQQVVEEQQTVKFRAIAENAQRANDVSQKQIKDLKDQLTRSGNLSEQQVRVLSAQISSLQMAAGLTRVEGRGIRIVLNDNADAAKAVGDRSGFAPGLIHDFDLQQIINELRAASAEAISIKGVGQSEGTRITGFSPIRCVGPVIHIDWEPVAPPFIIEAVGNPEALDKAVNMAGGILKNLSDSTQGAALQVKTTQVDKLVLSPATGAPRFRVAKSAPATRTP